MVPSNDLLTEDLLSLDCNCPGPPPIFNIPAPPFPVFLEEECEEFETCDFQPAVTPPVGDNQLPTLTIILLILLIAAAILLVMFIVIWRRKKRKPRKYLSGKSPPGDCVTAADEHIRYNDLTTAIRDHRDHGHIAKKALKLGSKKPFTFTVNPRLDFPEDSASQTYNASQDSCNPVYEEISEGCDSRPLSECDSKCSLDSSKPSSSDGRKRLPRPRGSGCYDDDIPMVEKYDPELRKHRSFGDRRDYIESVLSNKSPKKKQPSDLGEILDRLNIRMPPPLPNNRSAHYQTPSGYYRTERPSRRDRRPCPECQQGYWDTQMAWPRERESPRTMRVDDPRFSSLRSPKSRLRYPGSMAVIKNVPGDVMISPYAYDHIDHLQLVHEDQVYPVYSRYPGQSPLESSLPDPSRPTHTSSSGGSRDSYGSDSGYTGSNTLSRQHSLGGKDPLRHSNRSTDSGHPRGGQHCRGHLDRRRQRPCDHLSPTEDEPLYYPHLVSR